MSHERRYLLMVPVLLSGCMQEMAQQPAYRPLRVSTFFADRQATRPQVAGTVARGQLTDEGPRFTGRDRRGIALQAATAFASARPLLLAAAAPALDFNPYADAFPMPVTPAFLARGQERFDIFCSMCHDRAGTGNGLIAQRGYVKPPSYHTAELRNQRPGFFFEVITRGRNGMPDYATQIVPDDRWAIVAYVRALQLSQNATPDDVPEKERHALGGTP